MKQMHQMQRCAALVMAAGFLLLAAGVALAQASSRLIGTITAIKGRSITVRTDAGQTEQVTIPDGTSIKRVEPGQNLSAAAAIQVSDLAVDDRVLMRLDPSANPPRATMIVAMKHSDVAERQQKEREAWQQGVAGLVKNVNPVKKTIVVTTGAGPALRIITVHLSDSTVLLRYAPESVNFADAKPAPLSAIKMGDQLRARGSYNADRSQIAADAIVSGTFRNIAGLVTRVDPAGSKFVVKDLATKKSVTVHVAENVQMRRLPERMAQMIAIRLKGGNLPGEARGSANRHEPVNSPAEGARWSRGKGEEGHSANDMSRVLGFAPEIKLSDLKKGDAVMVVATSGFDNVNAITLLTGVEPLLEAPEATDLLSNWSMGGGGAEAAAGPQ